MKEFAEQGPAMLFTSNVKRLLVGVPSENKR